MARISLQHRRTPFVRLMEAYSRRRYGDVLQPGLVALHHRKVLRTMLATERRVARWNALPDTLAALVVLVAAGEIGCSWCMDFGYAESHHRGVDPAKLRDVPRWRTSPVYDETERDAMELAVAMTATPPSTTDDLVERLRVALGEEALVELVWLVAVENQRSRVNAAFGLTSQGFREACELRPA